MLKEVNEEYKTTLRQNFEKIIAKAKTSCENSDISAFEHFVNVNKTIKLSKNIDKKIFFAKF